MMDLVMEEVGQRAFDARFRGEWFTKGFTGIAIHPNFLIRQQWRGNGFAILGLRFFLVLSSNNVL